MTGAATGNINIEKVRILKYCIETHCHTFPVSGCSSLSPEQMISLYEGSEYSAMVLTNHFTDHFFRSNTLSDYLKPYYEMKKIGENAGIEVILGAEFRFSRNSSDYLLIGTDEEFLEKATGWFDKPDEEFHDLCNENGVLFFQAHPFRDGMVRTEPAFLDGIEACNCHADHNSRNSTAVAYAKENGLRMLSGSDAHHPNSVRRGGIRADILPGNANEFKSIILSGNYELIIPEEYGIVL